MGVIHRGARRKRIRLPPLCPHVARMRHVAVAAMPSGKKTNPVQVSFPGAEAIVQIPNPVPDLVRQAGRLQGRIAGFTEFL